MQNMYHDRVKLYKQLEASRGSKVLAYVTGDRPGLETQMHQEVLDFFVHHLDLIGDVEKISLYLYTRGGQTLAAWSIANLVRQYCRTLEIIVPSKAHSAGTLLCLGAELVVMTRQATLGPIDPSVNSPLGPMIPGAPPEARVPVSVEEVNGFIELAVQTGVTGSSDLAAVLSQLSAHVHPLVLGNAFRSRTQIRMLGRRLLNTHLEDESQVEKVLSFLCSESGSHDYTIYAPEAGEYLGLNIETPDSDLYKVIKAIYDDIAGELQLNERYDVGIYLGTADFREYEFPRALVESVSGGSHQMVTCGRLRRVTVKSGGQVTDEHIRDTRTFEGWRLT